MNSNWPILQRLEICKGDFAVYGPLHPETAASLNDWFRTELTYTSNAIEGSALTRSETVVLLEHDIVAKGKRMRDHADAVNHAAAWGLVLDRSQNAVPTTAQDVLDIHSLVLRGDPQAGQLRTSVVFINGEDALPHPQDLPQQMRDFAAWLETQPPTPATAFTAHLRLVDIHPFIDGNGRTARLLGNLILMKGGYLPAVVPPEERVAYIDSIKTFCQSGSVVGFACFMGDMLEKTYTAIGKSFVPQAMRPGTVISLPLKRPAQR